MLQKIRRSRWHRNLIWAMGFPVFILVNLLLPLNLFEYKKALPVPVEYQDHKVFLIKGSMVYRFFVLPEDSDVDFVTLRLNDSVALWVASSASVFVGDGWVSDQIAYEQLWGVPYPMFVSRYTAEEMWGISPRSTLPFRVSGVIVRGLFINSIIWTLSFYIILFIANKACIMCGSKIRKLSDTKSSS